jgi:hypothetical protein
MAKTRWLSPSKTGQQFVQILNAFGIWISSIQIPIVRANWFGVFYCSVQHPKVTIISEMV